MQRVLPHSTRTFIRIHNHIAKLTTQSSTILNNMKAVVTLENKTAGITTSLQVPSNEKDEVLVKVVGVTLNPTDWKHIAFLAPQGVIVGCDFAGVVEKVGADVKHVQIGDKVGGLVHGSKHADKGAFAEHTATIADVIWKKPDHLTYEETASFGVGALTAAVSLYQRLELPPPSKPAASPVALLVWAGSTSVGQFAIQFGKLSGLTVVTTASPKNFDYLKSLGADHVFDYNDADVVKKIKEATHNKLGYILDCISEEQSHKLCNESFGDEGGKGVSLLGKSDSDRQNVHWYPELLYTAMGKEFEMRGKKYPAAPEDRAFVAKFIKDELNQLLADKKIKPNKMKQMEGGLDKIPEGLDYLKSGKASLEKLAYRVQNE